MFPLDPKQLKAVFSSKKPEYRTFFPEKVFLNMVIPNGDNLRLNYPLKYRDYPFAIVTYTVFENWASKSYRKYPPVWSSSDEADFMNIEN
jgi:hypothetical protein